MDFSFTEDQHAIRDLAARIFERRATIERLRAIEASDERIDRELWADLAEAKLLGVALPEDFGGGGLGIIELCLLLEQQGRCVGPVPLWPTLILGALAIAHFGSPEQRQRWLPLVVEGELFLTAALAEPGSNQPLHSSVIAHREGERWRLDGTKMSVPAAHAAGRVLVPARTSREALGVFLVDPAAPGVKLERAVTTNREIHSHLHLEGVPGEPIGDPEGGAGVVAWIRDRALLGLCALQLGVAEEALRRAAEYTSNRRQFGKPLSTFQATAHRAADAYIDTEAMRATLWYAAWRLSEGQDATSDVVVAKWWAADAGQRVVHAVQHLHGGIGADVEYPVHRYFLWGKQIEVTLGGASAQLARLGRAIAEVPA